MRTILLGNAGAGKSTLAKRLAESEGAAILSLDEVAFSQGSERRPLTDSIARAVAFTERHEHWVIEGCYADIVGPLLPRCDRLIFLNPGIAACVENCRRRPWEPDKYDTPEAQERGLAFLLDWVAAYETRSDEFGLKRHRALFDAFSGEKQELRGSGPGGPLRLLADDLWVADAPLRFLGIEVGARMTVVRLRENELLLHSPIAATPELVRDVSALGRVAHLVAPNRFHHLFVSDWQRICPGAATYLAPGLAEKRADLAHAKPLGDAPEPAWQGVLEQVALEGAPLVNEVVFFHRPSATLIASDLAFHIGAHSPRATRLAFRLLGAYGRLTPSLVERLLARDRAAFRRGLERVLAWPFERVIVAHGEVCERGAREMLERGYAWILEL